MYTHHTSHIHYTCIHTTHHTYTTHVYSHTSHIHYTCILPHITHTLHMYTPTHHTYTTHVYSHTSHIHCTHHTCSTCVVLQWMTENFTLKVTGEGGMEVLNSYTYFPSLMFNILPSFSKARGAFFTSELWETQSS